MFLKLKLVRGDRSDAAAELEPVMSVMVEIQEYATVSIDQCRLTIVKNKSEILHMLERLIANPCDLADENDDQCYHWQWELRSDDE